MRKTSSFLQPLQANSKAVGPTELLAATSMETSLKPRESDIPVTEQLIRRKETSSGIHAIAGPS
ncbi:MAG TPA: hypothetical protein VMV04_04955 [Thermodesulfobacteriota bacterium]|nr:hypothetical protein [Thermodesulfobacteriota bacterium]